MAKSLVFVNQKGGVGKTTSCINIGAYVALSGYRTLLVDFDSQANMSSGIGLKKEPPTVYDLLSGQASIDKVIRKTAIKNLDAIPASIDLSGASVELVNQKNREYFLKNNLASIKDSYDYILFDCPPSLGLLTLNALAAGDIVLIPMQCEYFALEGMTLLLRTVRDTQNSINKELKIGGVFFTMFDVRTRLCQDVVAQVKTYFKDLVFDTIIPRNVRLSESPSHGLPICLYDKTCSGAKSYESLTKEIITRIK